MKLENGHAIGSASHPLDASAMIPRSLDVKFNVALLKSDEALPAPSPVVKKSAGPAANVKPTVSGTFMGNGKEAKLNYVSARWTEPFDGKPGISLVFTERDHAKDKKPDNAAMFGRFGNALILSLHEDGSIYSCQVVHGAMKNKGFSSSGSIEATPFTYEDGKVEGEITTNGNVDAFNENWAVKLKFVAPLGEIPKEFQVAEEKAAANDSKQSGDHPDAAAGDDRTSGISEGDGAGKSAGPKAKELALTKDAAEVDYKALVEHIDFDSKQPVTAASAELTAGLKAQGWDKDGSDMISASSGILKRKKGSAKLTIFVKPNGGATHVRIMTEGLSWDK